MPLRKLMKIAGDTVQKIKPVLLMSPVSVAQFLPPGSVDFDLLVIDSTIRRLTLSCRHQA
jgi:superfamily I DNA and/or RNA helicase